MATLTVVNLTASEISFQDSSGQTGLSFTLRGHQTRLLTVTDDEMDALTPQLNAAQAASKVKWSASDTQILAVNGYRKSLVSGVAMPILSVDMDKTLLPPDVSPDNSWSGRLFFAVDCTDGTDVQTREGDANVCVALKLPNTFATAQAVSASGALTAGTLTVAFTWTTLNRVATLNVTATTSLTPIELFIGYALTFATHEAFTFL
jgi:hypothetical protein